MVEITDNFLARIESLGDNCELGFVMRNLKYEKGGLFRWSITRVEHLLAFFENPDQTLYCESDLQPFSPGMVVDKRTGFSFHSKMKSEKNAEGLLCYSVEESERLAIYEQEKSKIDYLRKGFIERLNSDKGSVYLIKANKGIESSELEKLASILSNYSSKHVLVEVRGEKTAVQGEILTDVGSHYVANISRFAPYVKANDVVYAEWHTILAAIAGNKNIAERIG